MLFFSSYKSCSLSPGSAFTPAATAFALSLYSQLLQHCTQSIDSWKKLFQQGHAPESAVILPYEDDQLKDSSVTADKPVEERSEIEEEIAREPRPRRRKARAAAGRRRRRVAVESDSEEEGEETGQIEEVSEDDLSEGGGDFESDELSPELSDLSDGDEASQKQPDLDGMGGGARTSGKRPLAIRFPGMSGLQEQLEDIDTHAREVQSETTDCDVRERDHPISSLCAMGSADFNKEKSQLEPAAAAFLRWLCSRHFLPSVKVVFDWLRIHPAIVASCTQVSE